MGDKTVNLKQIKRGSLNKIAAIAKQDFFVTDSDDVLSIGEQLNKQFSVPKYPSLTGIVMKVEQITPQDEDSSIFSFLYDSNTSTQSARAYVFFDVIHDVIANRITENNYQQLLTTVDLTGDAAGIGENALIEVSFTDGDYSVGKFIRDVTSQNTDARPQTTTTVTDQFCNKPSAVPSVPAPSSNTPTPPTQAGSLPRTEAQESTIESPELPNASISQQPCEDVQGFAPLDSQVPGVPFQNVFARNQTNPRKLREVTCFVIHISAGATSLDSVVKVLNKKNLSVHFVIDDNGVTTQLTDLQTKTAAQGSLNSQCISIECLNPSRIGAPSRRFTPGSPNQMEALWQLLLKLQPLVRGKDGQPIPLRSIEASPNGTFKFGVLPFGLDKKRNGIIAHGSANQGDPSKQHSDGRWESCYCHLRGLGFSPQQAYQETTRMSNAASKGGANRDQPIPTP